MYQDPISDKQSTLQYTQIIASEVSCESPKYCGETYQIIRILYLKSISDLLFTNKRKTFRTAQNRSQIRFN